MAILGCAVGIPAEGFLPDAAADSADTTSWDPPADSRTDTAAGDTAVDDAAAADTAGDAGREDVAPDAVDAEDDGAAGPCDTNLGTFLPGQTATMWDGTYGEYWDVFGSISPTLVADPLSLVAVQSNMGMGGPVTPGTYAISSFVSPLTCSVCIFAMEGCDMTSGACAHMYAADSATLDITALEGRDGGLISGMLYDAHMVEVEQETGDLVPGGRTLCLDAWSFSELFVAM
jgi:hypothetical protein